MKTILVGGVFDHLHKGHAYFLQEAKKLGDELIVIVANDEQAKKKNAHQTQKERMQNVKNLHIADKVVAGNKKRDYEKFIKRFKATIVALGYDQKLPVKKEKLRKLGVKVKKIKRLEDYSSSKIRKKTEKKEKYIDIIGVSHISPDSVKEIKKKIRKKKPECVAVELDPNRFEALRRGETVKISAIRYIGIRNYILAKIMSLIQQYLGKKTGVIPGEEMLTAVRIGIEEEARIALIDMNLKTTLDRLKTIPLREKIGLLFSLFKKVKMENFDLNKVPHERIVEQLTEKIRETSPGLYRVMIEERNIHMANVLFWLSKKYNSIIAVVGAGHKKGIEAKLGVIARQR